MVASQLGPASTQAMAPPGMTACTQQRALYKDGAQVGGMTSEVVSQVCSVADVESVCAGKTGAFSIGLVHISKGHASTWKTPAHLHFLVTVGATAVKRPQEL